MHKHMSPIVNWSYEELMDYCAREAFDAILTGGGKELRLKFYLLYNVICQWQEAQDNE